MKNLAVFHPSSELYGADRILVIALKSMQNFRPTIYLPSNGPLVNHIIENLPNAKIVIDGNMPLFYRDLVKPKNTVAFLQKVRRFKKRVLKDHKQNNFNKIYFNTLACSPIALILRKLNLPKIFHVHEIIDKPEIARSITAKIALKHSDKIICVSNPVAKNILIGNDKYTDKVEVVNNGIDALCGNEERPSQEKIQFYLFGRIKPEKGQWLLIEALSKIDKSILKNASFNLVGSTLDGKEHLLADLKQRIQEASLAPFIKQMPFIANISSELAKADVCLIPSMMRDPFPTTVLEAMSAGKAVIATNHGGAVEAIQDNENGFLVDPNAPEQLAEKIKAFIENRDMAFGMGLRGKQLFENKFTIDQFNQRWLKAVA